MTKLLVVGLLYVSFLGHSQTAQDYYSRAVYSDDDQESMVNYNKAIKLNPKFVMAYFGRAELKDILEDYNGAIKDITKAMEIDPNTKELSYYLRAEVKMKLQDYQGAIADYSNSIEINPYSGQVYYHRGIAKLKLDDYLGAISDLTTAIKRGDTSFDVYFERGILKHKLEDYRGAIADFTDAIKSEPLIIGDTVVLTGNEKKDNKAQEEALARGRIRAIEANKPNIAKAFVSRGLSKLRLGDKNEACIDFSEAGELGSEEAYEMIKKYCN